MTTITTIELRKGQTRPGYKLSHIYRRRDGIDIYVHQAQGQTRIMCADCENVVYLPSSHKITGAIRCVGCGIDAHLARLARA